MSQFVWGAFFDSFDDRNVDAIFDDNDEADTNWKLMAEYCMKPFMCKCGKLFKQKSHLTYHMYSKKFSGNVKHNKAYKREPETLTISEIPPGKKPRGLL